LHDKPPALFVAEMKFRHGSGFSRLLIRRLNAPEVLPALSMSDTRQLRRLVGFLGWVRLDTPAR